MPERVRAGQAVALRFHAPGATEPSSATLRIPGMSGFDALEIEAPGTRTLLIPAGARPAWYRAELSGRLLRPTVSLFRVVP
jgi:hypothetical protein